LYLFLFSYIFSPFFHYFTVSFYNNSS
jgi:hypothetical protein